MQRIGCTSQVHQRKKMKVELTKEEIKYILQCMMFNDDDNEGYVDIRLFASLHDRLKDYLDKEKNENE